MEEIAAVLFDWDGTLYDSVAACAKAYNSIFSEFGLPAVTVSDVKNNLESDWRKFFQLYNLHPRHWDRAAKMWTECMNAELDRTRLYPGVAQLLAALRGKFKTGLVSGGRRQRVTDELKNFGIFDLFDVVLCRDDYTEIKPSPEPLLTAAKRLNVPAAGAVYIGDMPEDIAAAKKAGMFSIAITHGFGSRQKLEPELPDAIINNLAELKALFEQGYPSGLRSQA